MNQGEFFSFVIDVLEELDIPYMITGSVASMAYGEPRLTLDMDVVVDLCERQAEEFCRKFGGDFYKDLDSIFAAIRQRDHFNIIHMPSGSKIDFYQLKDDSLSQQMFLSRRQESFREDKMASFSRPEDIIINKLIFYKEGQSEKHLRDIQGMFQISGDQLDLAYIDKKTKELNLYSCWEKLKKPNSF